MSDATLPHVLAVEDNEETQLLLSHLLKKRFATTIVSSVTEAIEVAEKNVYELLLLDINLGGEKSGIDLLRELRTRDGLGETPAVALTAYAMPGDRERFLLAGFDAYVSKPFARADLLEVIRGALAAVE